MYSVYCQNAAYIYALSNKPFMIPDMRLIVMKQNDTSEKY